MLSGRKYLFNPSHGNYQLIMRVPADLQPVLNVKWIKRSLKTSNTKDAEIVLNGLLGKIQTSFALLRSGILDSTQTTALRASIMPPERTAPRNAAKDPSEVNRPVYFRTIPELDDTNKIII